LFSSLSLSLLLCESGDDDWWVQMDGWMVSLALLGNSVWFGMVWYGMVWYGVVWFGMVWNGNSMYELHGFCRRLVPSG